MSASLDLTTQAAFPVGPRLPAMCAVMPRAISISPTMIKFAPNFFRYSTSASEWARAMISRLGLSARPCSMRLALSKGFGMALINQRAFATLAAFKSPGWPALPEIASTPLALSSFTTSWRSSITRRGWPLPTSDSPTSLPTRP